MVKNFEEKFICFDRIHERDRQTDGRTPHDGIGRACIESGGKNQQPYTRSLKSSPQGKMYS